MRDQALNFNKLKISNLWTNKFSYGRNSQDWYVQTFLMVKRIRLNSNELVTILNMILLEVQYFFGDIFGILGISRWDEFLLPQKRIMEIFTSKSGIRFTLIDWSKKTHACRNPQMLSKKVQKTTMLHICWLEVKKVDIKTLSYILR